MTTMLTVRAVHTFVAEHGDELDFEAGDLIEVLEKDDAFGDGWWRGKNGKGEEGLFPATYVSQDPIHPNGNGDTVPDDNLTVPPTANGVHDEEPPAAAAAPVKNAAVLDRPESPKGGTGASTAEAVMDSTAAAIGVAAAGVSNVMGKAIGEVQNAIESIARPESDDEEELGIGQNARARLAEQAKLANEHRDRQRVSGGVTGLVYSDESEDEDEGRDLHPGAANGIAQTLDHDPQEGGKPVDGLLAGAGANAKSRSSSASSRPVESALQPALSLPATPQIGKTSSAGLSAQPASTWSIEEVVAWAQTKGFDATICDKFREHEITGDLLLELDANLLKELDIPQFGKRLRIAQAIAELRRPSSSASASSHQLSPGIPLPTTSSNVSARGMSAPPSAVVASSLSQTPPPGSNPDDPYAAWGHGRKVSTTPSTMPAPMEPINEGPSTAPTTRSSLPASTTMTTTAASSMPASPVTPNSTITKRESTGSMGHKKGKSSVDKQDRLSFFGRSRKPAPAAMSPGSEQRTTSRLGFGNANRVHQMQPATPEQQRKASGTTGSAAALKQIGTPDHSGYMKKKGETYGWKTRFFALKGADLYYMKSETEDRIKGHIDLRGHRVIVDENTNPGSYGFRLIGGDKPHFFSSSEQTAIREWMKALMKATIARDYSVPVTSSCNIPTIPLAEAQALSPRPPSPATRDATQRATRRENVTQLTPHDASVLMSLDTSSGQRRRASQNLTTVPSRPTRDMRRASGDMRRSSNSFARPSVTSAFPANEEKHTELVQWVNDRLPPPYPRARSIPESFTSGEVIFLLVRAMSGVEPNPPVPASAFAKESDGQPGIPGLFAMMDMLIDSGVDTAGVSINDIRSGDAGAIARLIESIVGWDRGRQAGVGSPRPTASA